MMNCVNEEYKRRKEKSVSYFCDKCNTEVRTVVVSRIEIIKVKGQRVLVDATVRVCSECSNDLFDFVFDEATLIRAFDEYKRLNGLLSSEAVGAIRKKHGVSPGSFSRLLGFDDKRILSIEKGSIQSNSENSAIKKIGC